MGRIMQVLKYSQAIQSCLMTYPTRSVLFAVKISGKASFKFMGKQDQALYLICFYLGRRFLIPLKCACRWSHDPCCPCVLARSSSSYSAQTWQRARLPAVLMSPGGLQAGGYCFFIRITKFPLQILPPRNKRKICFHQECKENIFCLPFLGFQVDMVESKFFTWFLGESEAGHLDFCLKWKGRDRLSVTPYTRQLSCVLRALPWVNYVFCWGR